MTTPTVEGLLTSPYVSLAEFKAAPTWIDSDDLIPGGIQSQQDAELQNVLLRASAWADNYCEQRLGAHTAYEQTRANIDRYGRIFLHPSNVPVRQIVGLAYGSDFQNLQQLTDLTQTWVEDARGIVVSAIPFRGMWSGTLEFGAAPPGGEVYVAYQYVAGYASTTLSASVTNQQNQMQVVDPTGFQPPFTSALGFSTGASTARIWDPGSEEAVQVASSYTVGSSTIPVTANFANAHAAGVLVSELPAEVHQAVICRAVSLLIRDDVAADEPFAGAPGPMTRSSSHGGAGGGLIEHACELLEPYRRVR